MDRSRLRRTAYPLSAAHREDGAKPAVRQTAARAVTPEEPADGLTRRERRVKEILLKELASMPGSSVVGGGLTYAEKQRLEKTLDVEYIDAELVKMREHLRLMPKLLWAGSLLVMAALGAILYEDIAAGTLSWRDFGFLLPVIPALMNPVIQVRATRRRIFIFEALRELTDADELDVQLDRITREADALITRIVDRELELEASLPGRLGLTDHPRRER